MLETDLYMLVCLAFNHWHTGIDDFMQYPQCVLAIHSSKRLLVEQITPPPFLLADAIINLTLAKGQRHEGREGMTAYYLTKVCGRIFRRQLIDKDVRYDLNPEFLRWFYRVGLGWW